MYVFFPIDLFKLKKMQYLHNIHATYPKFTTNTKFKKHINIFKVTYSVLVPVKMNQFNSIQSLFPYYKKHNTYKF